MKSEFWEAVEKLRRFREALETLRRGLKLETLRRELKDELEPLVGGMVLSEKPDDIVRNNWHRLLHKFEELIQRKKNRVERILNEIQQKLGDIKLKDIEKSLEWVKRELENIEESLERIRRKKRELKEELRRSMKKEELFIIWRPKLKIRIGEQVIEIPLVRSEYVAEEIKKLEAEEEELELKREKLLGFLELEKIPKELEKIKEELEKIKFIEAQSDEDKIREFIKDLIREMRREKVISYKPKLQESPEYWNNL